MVVILEEDGDIMTAVDGAPGTSTYVSERNGANDEIHVVVR